MSKLTEEESIIVHNMKQTNIMSNNEIRRTQRARNYIKDNNL